MLVPAETCHLLLIDHSSSFLEGGTGQRSRRILGEAFSGFQENPWLGYLVVYFALPLTGSYR